MKTQPVVNEQKSVGSTSAITIRLNTLGVVREQIAELKAIEKKALNDIREYMGDNELLVRKATGQVMATYKPYTSYRLDTKELKFNEPELYDEYSVRVTTRKFLLK